VRHVFDTRSLIFLVVLFSVCSRRLSSSSLVGCVKSLSLSSLRETRQKNNKKTTKLKKMLMRFCFASSSAGWCTSSSSSSLCFKSVMMRGGLRSRFMRSSTSSTFSSRGGGRDKSILITRMMNWRMDDGGDVNNERRDSEQKQRRQQQQKRTSSGGAASTSSSRRSDKFVQTEDQDNTNDNRRGRGGGRGGRKNFNNNNGGGRGEGGRGRGRGRVQTQTSTRNNNNSYYGNDEYENSSPYYYNNRDRQGGGGGNYNDNKPAYLQRKEERKATREQPTLRELALGEVIFGQNPVKEALLQNKRDEFYRLWIQEGDGGSYSSDEKMIARAKELGCTISYATKHDLNMLTESRPHQGVALDCTPLEMENIESLLEENRGGKSAAETERNREHSLWLALDEIIDPQNFGAILRTAHFLNIDGVVVCAKNSAPLSPVVSKASSGAMETIKVYQTNAMHKFLAKCVDDGFNVIGLANQSGAENVSNLSLNQPTVLVVGNEGSGLRTNVRRACSRIAKIEGGGDDENNATTNTNNKTTSVESLNVSVATAIALFQLCTSTTK
jgi:21S rRNA (GM2251-2'-O)-methyltransferase